MVSYADLEDFRAQARSFEEIGALHPAMFTLTGVDEPERVKGAYVSSSFFSLLRVEASVGRLCRPAEDKPGAENVAVVSASLWHRRFASDSELVGKTLILDEVAFTVVGILPADFESPWIFVGQRFGRPPPSMPRLSRHAVQSA